MPAHIECDELAVQDHATRGLLGKLGDESRKLGGELEPAPRAEPDILPVDEGEHAIAVELGLPHPVRAMERRIAGFGQHRRELRGHRFELARGRESRGGDALDGKELELLDRLAGKHRMVLRRDIGGHGEPVLVLDHEPLVLFLGAHECEGPLQLLAAQEHAELAFREAVADLALSPFAIVERCRAAFVGRVDAAIPDDHLAGAVLPGWNHAFERGIVVRVILGLDGKALLAAIERRTLGHGPGFEDAVAFEPEVVVQPRGRMLLDDEQERPVPRRGQRRRRLGGGREGPLGGILGKGIFRHGEILLTGS